jgi:LysM repeat protein
MRWRVIALVSLCVNIALAAGWLCFTPRQAARLPALALEQSSTNQVKTKFVLRRQLFSWQQIESADYSIYIANLRDVGCPEQTIRDIIIADVNQLYSRRRATELTTAEQQWWRSEPDTNIVRAAAEKALELENERRALLTRLLGITWETGDLASLPRPSRPGVVLDGAVLGSLPVETKLAIQDVSQRSQDRMQAYLDAQRSAGKEPDPVELAKLRQQTRDDLARLLSPPALEEFLLRYSQNANDLRTEFGQLRFFDPTPDEFRAVFQATDTLDQRIQLLADATDPGSVAARKALEDQRDNAIKAALGSKRYEEYHLLHDPVYRDAMATADEAGTPEAAGTFYAINLAALAEQNRIRGDTNLTADQKSIELKRLELEQLQANTVAKGRDLPPEPPPLPPLPPQRKVIIMGPGDSAATIATMYGLPVSAIKDANPNVDFNKLKRGDAIIVPKSPFSPLTPPFRPPFTPPLPP